MAGEARRRQPWLTPRLLALALLAAPARADDASPSTVTLTTTVSVRCQALRPSCDRCSSSGCQYCEVSSMVWRDPRFLSAAELEAQIASTDYACVPGSCAELLLSRPSTVHFRAMPREECASVVLPSPAWTTTTTTLPPPMATTANPIMLSGEKPPEDPDAWPHSWTPFHWIAVTAPVAVLLSVCCTWYVRCRSAERSKSRRVHIAPELEAQIPGKRGSGGAVWDFTQMGAIAPEQIDGAQMAIESEERQAAKLGRPAPPRRLAFASCNELGRGHFVALARLLDRHPATTVTLALDWRGASDVAIAEMAQLLMQRRGRVRFNIPRGTAAARELILPLFANPAALGDLGEALSVGGHSDLDAVRLVTAESTFGRGGVQQVAVPLGPLRLSAQELILSKLKIGDAGCAIACGFARPWAGRLTAARFLECDLGDKGAAEIARLLLGDASRARDPSLPAAASSLRELVLTANRIGDIGASALAEALPKCASLERLLIDRNLIGTLGARSLAQKCKRSGLRELMLGSHLGGNPVGPLGAEALAGAMNDELDRAMADRATRLQALNLESCAVGINGARALADVLPKSGLFALSLARCQLGNDGAKLILEAIPEGLMSLDLAGNELTDEAALVASEAMHRLSSLSVSLAQNSLSAELKAVLREEHGTRLRV